MEWYLTEPCQVGKNLLGEHVATQLAYIKGLSRFMLREGRAVVAEWTFWPSEHRDLKQFQTQNVAGARFLEEVRHGESDAGFDFGAIYKRLGTVPLSLAPMQILILCLRRNERGI